MTNREFKNKLKDLQTVKSAVLPNALWVSATRNMLLVRAKEEALPVQTQLISPVVLPRTFGRRLFFALRPVVATFMVAAFAVVGWAAGVSSSLVNKPGDLLYGLKSAAEKTQLTFTADPAARAYLHLELAGRRANELAVLAESNGADRENDMIATMNELQNEIVNVKKNLNEVGTTNTATSAAVAKAVDRKVAEIHAVFGKTKKLLSKAVQVQAEAVEAAADDVSFKAVAVLVAGAQTDEDKTDAATRVAEKINTAEKDMQVASTEAGEEAKAALAAAKAALAEDNLAEAIVKVQESAEIANNEQRTMNNEQTTTDTNANTNANTNTNTGEIKAVDL